MLLKELVNNQDLQKTAVYGLEINEQDVELVDSLPESIEEVGLVLKLDADSMIDESLLDVLITLRLKNIDVVLEVPSQLVAQNNVEIKYLLQLASNADFAVAFLPPGHALVGDSLTVEQYKQIVKNTTTEMLAKPNFDKFVYPVSSFFEYLMLEQILSEEDLKEFRPENEFIKENFASVLTKQDSDDFKSEIRALVHQFYGGKEEFTIFSKSLIESLRDKSKQMYKEQVEIDIRNNPQQDAENPNINSSSN